MEPDDTDDRTPPESVPRWATPAGRRADSAAIVAIQEWLVEQGVAVEMFDFNLHWGGRYYHETREIYVNAIDARDSLLALAHEAGHWIGYVLCEKRPPYQRERQAFCYGWRVLRLFGAIVTRDEWIVSELLRRAYLQDMTDAPPCSHTDSGRTIAPEHASVIAWPRYRHTSPALRSTRCPPTTSPPPAIAAPVR